LDDPGDRETQISCEMLHSAVPVLTTA
jgi:hypothetical protein